MKVVVIGSTGYVGKSLMKELEHRNFEILGISRTKKETISSRIKYVNLDVNDTDELLSQIKGYDVLISAYSAGWNNPNYIEDYIKASVSIQTAVRLSGGLRYIIVGGAGSLYVSEGLQAVDTERFPEEFKIVSRASQEYYLNYLKAEEALDWLYVSPPFEMHHGIANGRTGNYRFSELSPIFDENGKSSISVEDLAVAIVDEIKNSDFNKTIYTVAY